MAWDMKEAIAYYRRQGAPGDQSALVAFLMELQEAHGGVLPGSAVKTAAEELGTKESFLLALIRRMPRLRLTRNHTLELCAGPNCGKSAALAALAEKVCKDNPGLFELKFVPCMRLCGKGPNLRWDGTLLHKNTEETLLHLLEQTAAEKGKQLKKPRK